MALSRLAVKPIGLPTSFKSQAYHALKEAIIAFNIYAHDEEIRLDERQLSRDLGVSRTPIREAMSVLEHEGFVRTLPRRGVIVLRKTKREIVEMITVWAAIESMAARLVRPTPRMPRLRPCAACSTSSRIPRPRAISTNIPPPTWSSTRRSSGSRAAAAAEMTENLFIHMRAVRAVTIAGQPRAALDRRSHEDHRGAGGARRRPRRAPGALKHTLGLAAHVEKHVDFLD